MSSQRERDQERRRVKNSRERLKRRKERAIRNLHDYGLLSGARIFVVVQESTGDLTEYRNTSDRKFPPSYGRLRQLFPAGKFLTPESFGTSTAAVAGPSAANNSLAPSTVQDNAPVDFSLMDIPAGFDPFGTWDCSGFPPAAHSG
ncbi:uncharacterized protein BJX67DRAFT_386676 [Aspergillus lucknowensis]|uniref:MADS-box domain-containing protein n=1 Tax=Aspergillus lucknowensis TaxID=176173 RepID=A0ABR4L410_9EURO